MNSEPTHPALRRAIEHLAANCDGAASKDEVGFSKADAAYGHRMAVELAHRELDGREQIVIRDILVKYTRHQLEPAGIALPSERELKTSLGPAFADVDAGRATRQEVLGRLQAAEARRRAEAERARREAAGVARGLAPRASVSVDANPSTPSDAVAFKIGQRTKDFSAILAEIKALPKPERWYDGNTQSWLVRARRAAELVRGLDRYGIAVSPSAADRIERARTEREAEVGRGAEVPGRATAPSTGRATAPEPDVRVAFNSRHVLVSVRGGCPQFFSLIASIKDIDERARFERDPVPHWQLPLASAERVLATFPDAEGADTLRAYVLSLDGARAAEEAERISRLERMLAHLGPLDRPLASGRTLRPFQREGVRFLLESVGRDGERGAIVGDDMGLGKTVQVLVAAKALAVEHDAAVFAITKASLLDNWRAEAALAGASIDVFSNHYERIPEPLEDQKFVVLVDEAHAFKSISAKKTQALLPLVEHPNCVAVFPISGTIAPNGRPQELYVPLRAINHEVARDEKAYKKRYCNASQTTIKHYVRGRVDRSRAAAAGAPAHLVELHRRIKRSMLRRTKAEIQEQLPKFTRSFVQVELSAAARARYRAGVEEARRIYEAKVADSEIRRQQAAVLRATLESEISVGTMTRSEFVSWAGGVAPDAKVQAATLLEAAERTRIAGDNLREPDAFPRGARARLTPDDERWATETAADLLKGTISREGAALVALTHARRVASEVKVETTIEMVEEMLEQGRRPLVFTDFRPAAEAIATHFDVTALTGDTNAVGRGGETGARQRMVDDFNAGKTPLFVGTIEAGGEGLNITGGADVILHDRAWTPGMAQQVEARAYRMGQTADTVFSWWLQAFAIDRKMDETLEHKHAASEVLYTGVQATLEGRTYSYLEVLDEVLKEVDGRGLGDGELAKSRSEREDGAPDGRDVVAGANALAGRSPSGVDGEAHAPPPVRIPLEGSVGFIDADLAAAAATPRLQAPDGASSFERLELRESYVYSGGTLAVVENPSALDRTADRFAVLDLERAGETTRVRTLLVVDGTGVRHVPNARGARVAASTSGLVAGAGLGPDDRAALAGCVGRAAPSRDPDSLLSRLVDLAAPVPGFEPPSVEAERTDTKFGSEPIFVTSLDAGVPVHLAALMASPALRAGGGVDGFDEFRLRETYRYEDGSVAVLEDPTASTAGRDRWVVLDVRVAGEGISSRALMVVDGGGARHAFDGEGNRVAVPDCEDIRLGRATAPQSYGDAIDVLAVRASATPLASLLARLADPREPAPGFGLSRPKDAPGPVPSPTVADAVPVPAQELAPATPTPAERGRAAAGQLLFEL